MSGNNSGSSIYADKSASRNISVRSVYGYFQFLNSKTIKTEVAIIGKIINPQFKCMYDVINSMFEIKLNNNSNCEVIGLTDKFKDLICDAVNNYCPYYYYYDNGSKSINNNIFSRNLLNFSSDNSVSFFHEQVIDNDLLESEISFNETENYDSSLIDINANFISKNLSNEEFIKNNILSIINLENIQKGTWILNGNITIEIPKNISMKNLKMFI